MLSDILRRLTLPTLVCVLLCSAMASAQSVPAPLPSAVPSAKPPDPALTLNGYVRVYDFFRTNLVQNASNPNRSASNFAGSLGAKYRFGDTGFYAAATYYGADPFGTNGIAPQKNGAVDNTLPGFALSTFGESYLGFTRSTFNAKLGNQIINTPWANASDSRLKPAAFQGVSAAYVFAPGWTAVLDDMVAFESRTSNAFGRYTLLTAPVPGASDALVPSNSEIDTGGFLMGGLTYQPDKLFTVSVDDYQFDDIANMAYAQGQYNFVPESPVNPYVAFQYVNEVDTGAAVIGKIDNQTYGAQVGANVVRNVALTGSVDYAPWHQTTVPLASCSSATYLTTGYFLPGGGTPDCVASGNGTATIFYGGIASPYTDSYATDPLFTTSISQGMADRRSAGTGFRIAATAQLFAKHLRLIAGEGYYNYVNPAGPNLTREFNADATYFLNHVGSGPYRGLFLRYRYADRSQPTLPFDFKYNRAQLEYDF